MLLGLRWSLLLLWISGCASQRLVVAEEDWQTVPAAQRASVDRRHDADLAAARRELAAASADLDAFRRAHPVLAAPAARPPRAQPPGEWSEADRDHEQARGAAFVRVEADKAAWLRADLAWRELRIEAADARLELVVCDRELVRGRTIDRNLLGSESYDTAPLRGQFSRAQQRWYAASTRAGHARDALERASASLASSKEAYAQLIRNGPARLRSVPTFVAAEDRPARLELTSWVVLRSDIRRRRGLRHFLDAAAAAPAGLRRAKLRLAARAIVLPPIAPGIAATAPPAPAAPPAPIAPRSATPAPPATATTKPPIVAPAPAIATKPPTPPPAATKPTSAAPPAPATKTASAAPAPPAAKPAPAKLPAAPPPKPPTPAPTSTKTASAAPLTPAPSKTPPAPRDPPAASNPTKPVESPPPSLFEQPSLASQPAPTSTAKPAESSDPSSR